MHFGSELSLIIGCTTFGKRLNRAAVVPIFIRRYVFSRERVVSADSETPDRLYHASMRFNRAMRLNRNLVGGCTGPGFSIACLESLLQVYLGN